ncbi:MAG: DUF3783 domain-containing protein [Candidatus Methanofastidiosa archaeon]|nr:DUF3783 domain-containing protein [Candidatus Methanofastidiosa archaeon]
MKKEKHIVTYGYSKEDTQKIKLFLENKLSINLIIISASGKENVMIADIIESGEAENFQDKENKVLMFLDFLDEEIRFLLYNFSDVNIAKPLFCVLTEHNINWTFAKLIEDLIEERKYFEEQKKKERRD